MLNALRPFSYLQHRSYAMPADTKRDYTIYEIALSHAGIDASRCMGSVEQAQKMRLSGWENALHYLGQIESQIESGILEPSRVIRSTSWLYDEQIYYLRYEDACQWRPNEPLSPLSTPEDIELSDRQLKTYLNLVRALIRLVMDYESGKRIPNKYPHDKILTANGDLNIEGLKRLLQDIDDKTPKRADLMIKRAMDREKN